MSYAGRVDGPVRVTLGPGVQFDLVGLRVIDHPHPMLLLGADILRGGRPAGEWNFAALRARTLAPGNVEGWLVFQREKQEAWCPCTHFPAVGKVPFAFPATLPTVQGQPINLVAGMRVPEEPPVYGGRGVFRVPQ